MPTYQYRCSEDHELEVVQSFTDEPLTACPECGAPVRKVYGSVGVVFKGSGFYRNDSRDKSASTSSPAANASSDSKATASSESKTSTATPAKESNSSSGSGTAKSSTASTSSAGSAA